MKATSEVFHHGHPPVLYTLHCIAYIGRKQPPRIPGLLLRLTLRTVNIENMPFIGVQRVLFGHREYHGII